MRSTPTSFRASDLRYTKARQPHGASMLISGKEKLERMRDGRVIYIGAERVRAAHALRALLCRQFDHRAQSERPRGAVGDIPCHGRRAAGTRADAQIVGVIHRTDGVVESTAGVPAPLLSLPYRRARLPLLRQFVK